MTTYILPLAIAAIGVCWIPNVQAADCKADSDFTSNADLAESSIGTFMGIKKPYQQKLAKSGEPPNTANQFYLFKKGKLLYVKTQGLELAATVCAAKKGVLVVRLAAGLFTVDASVKRVGDQKFKVSATGYDPETFEVANGKAIQ